ncbi:MAG TPA: hypothetical protein VGO52_14595 [Hyphomonadaceae bacterium]|jgi:hypothetical protein|nr:hypothetical protein [Hyphomonadaceae bacterium]
MTKSKFKLSRDLTIRLASAGALLAVGMTTLSVGAQLGVVHLNAGDMKIAFGRGESGLTLDVAARTCPPHCSFDIGWRPLAEW